jgi:hypothetical protein
MVGSVLSFLKAEWKVSDTGSAYWASSYWSSFHNHSRVFINNKLCYKCDFRSHYQRLPKHVRQNAEGQIVQIVPEGVDRYVFLTNITEKNIYCCTALADISKIRTDFILRTVFHYDDYFAFQHHLAVS